VIQPKVFHFPGGYVFHATRQCPTLNARERGRLVMSYGIPEVLEGEWWRYESCRTCCPIPVTIVYRGVHRLPIVFHADEICRELEFQPTAPGQDWLTLEEIAWPSQPYEHMLGNPKAWLACATCIPSPEVLYPLGSSERPHPPSSGPTAATGTRRRRGARVPGRSRRS
jgi:hypothetical protein